MTSTLHATSEFESEFGGRASGVLGFLHAGFDEADELGMLGWSVDECEGFAVGMLQIVERAKAAGARAVAECDRRGVGRKHGHASTTSYLAMRTGWCSKSLAPSKTLGRWIDPFEEFASAWAAGVLSEAHVRELRKLDNARTHRMLHDSQRLLIEQAKLLEFKDWLSALGYWLLHADPDGSLPRPTEKRPGLTMIDRKGGAGTVIIDFDPLLYEAFKTMIEHRSQRLFRAQEDNPDLPPLTPRERDLVALMKLLVGGFQRPDGSFPVPLINLVVSQKLAEDLVHRMSQHADAECDPHRMPMQWDNIDGRCETIRGTPLDPRRLLPALLVGRLRRQVLNAKGRTIDLGHDVRLFPPALKNALLVESRGHCRTIGCNAPFAWLVADHIQPHTKGGPTDLWNGQILCNPRERHQRRFVKLRDERPLGSVYNMGAAASSYFTLERRT